MTQTHSIKTHTDGGKNIFLFSDGTGNSGGKRRGTNVYRLFNAVDTSAGMPAQVKYYSDGVGTAAFKPLRLLGAAFGLGLAANVRRLYKFAAMQYVPGDRIYLFGFSRGAFTARLLAGMICKCGLPETADRSPKEIDSLVRQAYRAYRKSTTSEPGIDSPAGRFKRSRANNRDVPIECIGVWDTVDAVGLPWDELTDALNLVFRFRFRRNTLHPLVRNGLHAIALDDERHTFHPVMWNEAIRDDDGKVTGWDQRIEQVWFAGMHSNVGGGYPRDQMSIITLNWMIERMRDRKLDARLDASLVDQFKREADANGKMYDSRSGLGTYYRFHPRSVEKLCDQVIAGAPVQARPRIHHTVFDRITNLPGDYAPTALPTDFDTIGTAKHTAPPNQRKLSDAHDQIAIRRLVFIAMVSVTAALVTIAILLAQIEPAPEKGNAFTNGFFGVLESLCPSFIAPYIMGYQNAPFVLYTGLIGFSALLFCDITIRKSIKHLAADAWTRRTHTNETNQSLTSRLRTSGLTQRTTRKKERVMPWLVIIGTGVALLVVAGRFGVAWQQGWRRIVPSELPATPLTDGQSCPFQFDTKTTTLATPVILFEGEIYKVSVTPATGATELGWEDDGIPVTPDGVNFEPLKLVYIVGIPWRRVVLHPWYQLQGQIGPDGRAIPLGTSATFNAHTTGRLHLFVNDTCYGNNSGLCTVTITHIPKRPEIDP